MNIKFNYMVRDMEGLVLRIDYVPMDDRLTIHRDRLIDISEISDNPNEHDVGAFIKQCAPIHEWEEELRAIDNSHHIEKKKK